MDEIKSQYIRAISLWQPWATLYVGALKHFETRHWPTNHRGPLAIHAAQRRSAELVALCKCEPFRSSLAKLGYHSFDALPRGGMVGKVCIANCHPTKWAEVQEFLAAHPDEVQFGDFGEGRFAWEAANPVMFDTLIPERGQQGFWSWLVPRHVPTTFHRKPTIITGAL